MEYWKPIDIKELVEMGGPKVPVIYTFAAESNLCQTEKGGQHHRDLSGDQVSSFYHRPNVRDLANGP